MSKRLWPSRAVSLRALAGLTCLAGGLAGTLGLRAQESSPSGHYFYNTLGLAGDGANSYVDKSPGDDMLPYTSDDITLPALGNLGGTWSIAHLDNNSDNKITADEHIFSIIRRDDDDAQEFSSLSRPEYGVLYESEDWWDYHDARNEALASKDIPYDENDPSTWLDAAGGDFEHNDDNGWCGESNAILYNNLRANQHGEGKPRYYFELINPSNTDSLPDVGWVYDEIEGWEKTLDIQANFNNPNTPEDDRAGPGNCRRWMLTTNQVIRGYLVPVEDLAGLADGSLTSLFGWETVDLAKYLRETIAPKLDDPDLNIFTLLANELGIPSDGTLPPTHLMLLQLSVPLDPNGQRCGGNDAGAEATAAALWGVPAEGGTYRVSHLLGFNADFTDAALNAAGVRRWVDKPDDGAERNLWLQDLFYRDDTSHLGKYSLVPPETVWSIVDDPEFKVLDNTKDRILVSGGAGAVVAPIPKPLGASERPLEVVADLAEDIENNGSDVIQIALLSDTDVLAYAELNGSSTSLNLGGTMGANGLISGPARTVAGTGSPDLGSIDRTAGTADYTRYILQVNADGIKLGRIADGGYDQNDFNDVSAGGTNIASLTFAGDEGVGDVSRVSIYGSGATVVTTLAVFAGLPVVAPAGTYLRADSNCDGKLDISDAVNTLNVLFLGTGSICCPDASDSNGDSKTDLSDAVYGLNFLFQGGAAPPAPYPDCGGSGCEPHPCP